MSLWKEYEKVPNLSPFIGYLNRSNRDQRVINKNVFSSMKNHITFSLRHTVSFNIINKTKNQCRKLSTYKWCRQTNLVNNSCQERPEVWQISVSNGQGLCKKQINFILYHTAYKQTYYESHLIFRVLKFFIFFSEKGHFISRAIMWLWIPKWHR